MHIVLHVRVRVGGRRVLRPLLQHGAFVPRAVLPPAHENGAGHKGSHRSVRGWAVSGTGSAGREGIASGVAWERASWTRIEAVVSKKMVYFNLFPNRFRYLLTLSFLSNLYSSQYSAAMFNFFGGGEPKPQQSAGAQWSQTVKDEESAAKRRGKVRQRASAVAARNGRVREAERKRERHGWFEWREGRAGVTGTERERESARASRRGREADTAQH